MSLRTCTLAAYTPCCLLLRANIPMIPDPGSIPSVWGCVYPLLSFINLIVNGSRWMTLALPSFSNNLAITFLQGITGLLFFDMTYTITLPVKKWITPSFDRLCVLFVFCYQIHFSVVNKGNDEWAFYICLTGLLLTPTQLKDRRQSNGLRRLGEPCPWIASP